MDSRDVDLNNRAPAVATDGDEAASHSVSARHRIVREAIDSWRRQLIDLGGRNNLLYFRDLRAGTLDLTNAVRGVPGEQLLEGRAVRLSQLFSAPDDLRDAARRARTLRAKAIENDEERGLQTLHVGYGLATWESDRSSATPNAPVVLFRLSLTPIGVAGEDFELELEPEPEVNPTLLHLLETDFRISVNVDELLEGANDVSGGPPQPGRIVEVLRGACRSVSGFQVVERVVAGNFSYAKLPMVADLDRAHEQIAEHDLLSAIAGDADARDAVRERHRAAATLDVPVVPPPDDEFLVLDADSSQSRVIASAVAGADVVVIGPPGTGKSQTIANLVATLIARGRSVLFVAEKRAAIEAVMHRLEQRELGDLVLDLHDGASNRRRVAAELDRALSAASEALAPDVSRLHRQLDRRRDELEQYAAQLHAPVSPWGISAFEAQARILGIPQSSHTDVRFRGETLQALTPDLVVEACEDARRFVELGGPRVLRAEHPWAATYAARKAIDAAAVERISEQLHDLVHALLPLARDLAQQAARLASLPMPATLEDAGAVAALLDDADDVLNSFTPAIFDLDLDNIVVALSPAASIAPLRLAASIFNDGYRAARRAVRECLIDPRTTDAQLLELATLARDVAGRWTELSAGRSKPQRVAHIGEVAERHAAAQGALLTFASDANQDLRADMSFDDLEARLSALARERPFLSRFPELHRIERQLRQQELGPVLDVVVERDFSDDQAAQALDHAWLASILDRLYIEQPALAAFEREAQDAAVRDFVKADHAHIEVAAKRVRRAWAERAVHVRDEFTEETAQVARQASLKRRHMPIRDLFDRAEHVLTAVKPCWVMSPLVVAQVLPSRPCFDVVVFDEASQIPPADAACSLLRGRRAVVAGDPHQLPPTAFFMSGVDDDERELDDDDLDDPGQGTTDVAAALAAARSSALTQGQESILDVLRALLPPPHGTRVLSWHYRSKDERLITFSNAQESLYDWTLTTFPGALPGDSISHVLVPFRPGAATVTASVSDEVERVVELVIEHARTRPEESLGVIALGSTHANRIAEALRLASADHPELAAIMDEQQEEALFVKNLERVQGDERDAIILTVGYGKTPDGRMRYQFGPINQEGGQRRLNVAITRARRRMTVVSSFSGSEMDPERTRSIGAQMLRDYLLYAESGGTNLGLRARAKPSLNPFERDVLQHLEVHGIRLVPQFGASGYWIDFAATHPERPGEPVLAIEADGAMYHSSESARDRDRLRQEHLERLGWQFHRIWSTDWFRSREHEVEKVVAAYQRAVAQRDGADSDSSDVPDDDPPPDWLPVEPDGSTPARAAWPGVPRGRGIGEYSHRQLRAVVRWVKSDGRLYTEDELLAEVMAELGFRRRGSRIVEAIRRAIDAERRSD